MFLWICGVSGSGKTTLGKALYARLKPELPNIFMLDGDDFRQAVGDGLGYTQSDREINAMRIARFAHLLDAQDIHVICCAVTLPVQVQTLNRQRCRNYCEVFLDVTRETVVRRDPKRLYRGVLEGRQSNLAGFDISYSPPTSPHLRVDNNADDPRRDRLVRQVLEVAFPQYVGPTQAA